MLEGRLANESADRGSEPCFVITCDNVLNHMSIKLFYLPEDETTDPTDDLVNLLRQEGLKTEVHFRGSVQKFVEVIGDLGAVERAIQNWNRHPGRTAEPSEDEIKSVGLAGEEPRATVTVQPRLKAAVKTTV